jgi:hypothetical protein
VGDRATGDDARDRGEGVEGIERAVGEQALRELLEQHERRDDDDDLDRPAAVEPGHGEEAARPVQREVQGLVVAGEPGAIEAEQREIGDEADPDDEHEDGGEGPGPPRTGAKHGPNGDAGDRRTGLWIGRVVEGAR